MYLDDMEHYVRPDETSDASASPAPSPRRRGPFYRLLHLLDDREASHYPSVAPRRPDGSRPKIFPFNGNGMGH